MPKSFSKERRSARERRHLACEIRVHGKSHTAVVLNLSDHGLFVRSNETPPHGDPVLVVVRRPGGETWEIEARVAWSAGRQDLMGTARGIGLEILEAPPEYHAFVEDLAALEPDG